MKHNWKEIKLSQILKLNVDSVDVLSQTEFHFAGVYCFGNGLFEKGYLSGAETTYKTYNRLHKNHIAVSKVKGWEGAIALVTDEFDGMFLSPVNPTFNLISEDKVDIKYIDLFLKQKHVWQKLLNNSKGIGARRNSVSEKQFLDLSIPLPPLSEQQRIVSKIEGVKTKLDRIKILLAVQEKEIAILRNSLFVKLQKEFENIPISRVLVANRDVVNLNPDESYKQVTVKVNHKGVKLRGYMKGSDIGSIQFLAKENNFIISKIDARNGAMGMIPTDLDCGVVTNDFPLFSFEKNVDPKFFYYFSNTNYFGEACKKASEGTTNRKRLKMNRFLDILIPLPSIEEQVKIVKSLERINDIRQIHIQQEQELTELMPSLLDKAFKGELKYSKQEDRRLLAAEPTSDYHAKAKSLIPENEISKPQVIF